MGIAIADYLAHLRDLNRSPITERRYGDVLRRFEAYARAELQRDVVGPDEIDKALVTAFVREGGRPGTVSAPATRNSRLAPIRGLFRFLVREGRLAVDPSAAVPFAKRPTRSMTFLTESEVGTLCAAVERHATEHYVQRDHAIVLTFFHTGLRLSELLSLDLRQIDFETERFLQVRRKGGRRVDVHFNSAVAAALRRWLGQRRHYASGADVQAVFLSDQGRRLSARAVENLVTKYVVLAGISKHATVHTLRHSTATALISNGVPIEVTATALDHQSLDTTRIYVHLVGKEVHDAVAILARTLGPGGATSGCPSCGRRRDLTLPRKLSEAHADNGRTRRFTRRVS